MSANKSTRRSSTASPDVRQRIFTVARTRFFASGYSTLTMDELAAELGMSKKTLYRHFSSKDALIEAVLETFASEGRAMAELVFSDDKLCFMVKLHRLTEAMVRRFATIKPHVKRDLERFAPHISRRIEDLRFFGIPQVFGRIFRQGQALGMVRSDVDAVFAAEFGRTAINNMLQPTTLERLGITPEQTFERAIDLFFAGFLTNTGRIDFEEHGALRGRAKTKKRLYN